jgi:hypothetical protein
LRLGLAGRHHLVGVSRCEAWLGTHLVSFSVTGSVT